MKFYEYETMYAGLVARRPVDAPPVADESQFYKNLFHSDAGDRLDRARGLTEGLWVGNRKPYFRIWPGVLHTLAHSTFDLPNKYLKCPQDAFVIRFPVESPIRIGVFEQAVQAILVCDSTGDDLRRLHFGVQTDECYDVYQFDFTAPEQSVERSVEEQFSEAEWSDPNGPKIPLEEQYRHFRMLLSIVLSTCFLATGGDRIVTPDVLNKDLEKLLRRIKSGEPVGELVERAQRYGKNGHDVGRQEQWDINVADRHDSGESTGTGRELRYQHQRRGHFRVIRHGKGRELAKVVFQRQLTVRADLPPAPFEHGYCVK